jgi:hypothetical protein
MASSGSDDDGGRLIGPGSGLDLAVRLYLIVPIAAIGGAALLLWGGITNFSAVVQVLAAVFLGVGCAALAPETFLDGKVPPPSDLFERFGE